MRSVECYQDVFVRSLSAPILYARLYGSSLAMQKTNLFQLSAFAAFISFLYARCDCLKIPCLTSLTLHSQQRWNAFLALVIFNFNSVSLRFHQGTGLSRNLVLGILAIHDLVIVYSLAPVTSPTAVSASKAVRSVWRVFVGCLNLKLRSPPYSY